jgi:hypothetical protein
MHVSNASDSEGRHRGLGFKVNLGKKVVRPYLKNQAGHGGRTMVRTLADPI